MIMVVAILLVIVLGISYALFMQVTDNTNNQVVTTGTLQVEYSSNNGYISGETYDQLLPMSNDAGLTQSGYEFSVKNTGSLPVTYNVYIYINYDGYNADKTSGSIDGEIFEDLSLVKYNLQVNDDNSNSIYKISDKVSKEENGIKKYNIYTGSVDANNTINSHKLRIWLDEDIDTSNIGKYIYLKLEVASYVTGQEEKIVCKRASTLHTEVCSQTDTSAYCRADGYAEGDTITYGNLGTSGTLASGDAFDCDVNGDGTYDAQTERFYYVSDMTNGITSDSDTAVLIYYNNVSGGEPSNMAAYAYDSSGSNNNGPVTAKAQLPTITQWSNVSLKSTSRQITNEVGGTTTSAGNLPIFSYEGYAARLLTTQEIEQGCGFTVGNRTNGELSNKCKYLIENTKYSNSELTSGPWIESPYSSYSIYALNLPGGNRFVGYDIIDNMNIYGVRPAIEVDKKYIEY